jgi:hypothetical protein
MDQYHSSYGQHSLTNKSGKILQRNAIGRGQLSVLITSTPFATWARYIPPQNDACDQVTHVFHCNLHVAVVTFWGSQRS